MDIQDELRGLLLHHGPSQVVGEFITKQRDHLDLNSILEETFRRIDLGPRDLVCRQGAYVSPEVEFLLRQGARFSSHNCGKLLEDTYRYIELGPLEFKRRAGACLSPEVEFLLIQGASFKEVPCGLSQLVESTTEYLQQSDQNKDNFLYQQVMHDRIHHRWDYFLNEVYESLRKSVDSETLCHIVRLISRQQDEMKIYTMPFMRLTFSTRRFQMYKANLIDASIGELRRRLGELDEVTIRAQGRNINALSPLLQARSTYFKRLISDNSKKTSFEIEGLYKTIQFVVLYAHCKLDHVEREFGFEPCDSRDTTEKTLNELINILHAASTFEIADLFGAVEQHIMRYGHSFIYPKNAQEIKIIAKEVNAGILERYCDAFIATNLRTFTLFLSLPAELRLIIWRQVASQPRLVEVTWPGNRRQTPPHIARTLKVCRESHAEMQQFWGGPRIGGVNFQFDIIWFDTDDLPNDVFPRILKEAHYCAIVAPPYPHLNSNFWELEVSKVINCCPCLKVLYLATETLSDNDEIEYCRRFTNREPTTLVEARNWIEESAHQRLWENIPKGCGLPKIILVDETEMKRLSDIAI